MLTGYRSIIRAAGAALLIFTGLTSTATAADLTIRFAWFMPPNTATAEQANEIVKNIERESKGSIDVRTYPSGSLVSETQIGPALSNNTVNMGIAGLHWWASKEPSLAWDTIPFIVTDAAPLLPALHGKLGTDTNKLLEKQGVRVVGWGFYGYSGDYLNTKHEVDLPKDLKGLKLRSVGSINAADMRKVGATPVAMDSSEVYVALQRGALDGGLSGITTFISRKWAEVGKYATAIKYEPLVYPIQVNLNWWKSLTENQRRIITKAIRETEKDNLTRINKDFNKGIDDLKTAGVKVHLVKGDEEKQWKQAFYDFSVQKYLSETGANGKMLMNDINTATNTNH